MKNPRYISGFWERVDKAVLLSGKSKAKIAKQAGFNRKLLYGLTDGMHTRTLKSFCEITKVSADWLLFGGEMK